MFHQITFTTTLRVSVLIHQNIDTKFISFLRFLAFLDIKFFIFLILTNNHVQLNRLSQDRTSPPFPLSSDMALNNDYSSQFYVRISCSDGKFKSLKFKSPTFYDTYYLLLQLLLLQRYYYYLHNFLLLVLLLLLFYVTLWYTIPPPPPPCFYYYNIRNTAVTLAVKVIFYYYPNFILNSS